MDNKLQLSKDDIVMGFVVSCIEDVTDTLWMNSTEVCHTADAVQMFDEYIIP